MKVPVIAIIGRPNVGKSTFFNTIVEKNVSITSDESGTTRDRIIERAEWAGRVFNIVDTGGLDFDDKNAFSAHIREQVDLAISFADCIIFLVDGNEGIHPHDTEIANLLRRVKRPVVLAVNKLDNRERVNNVHDFYRLKIGQPHPLSCTQKTGIGDLLDAVFETLKTDKPNQNPEDDTNDTDQPLRIAIVGKPNAGKSSIVNRLLGEKRVMVSDIAGTTRDSIDTLFRYNNRDYIIVDTAGIRRKRSIQVATVEHYSVLRALAAIRSADVVVLVVDATLGLTEQDVRLAGYAHEEGKPSVICINKWDLVEKDSYTILDFEKRLGMDLAFMSYFRSIYISAETGQRVGEVMKMVEFVRARAETRLTTGVLNNLITGFVATTPPPMNAGKRPKIFYSTQVGINPPTFALFVSDREAIGTGYLRYLENCLRKSIDLSGTPVRFLLRNRSEK